MATSKLLLPALARAFALSERSDGRDADLSEAILEVQEILHDSGWLVVRVRPDGLALGGEVASDLQEDVGVFHAALDGAGIKELRFQGVLERESLEAFFRQLSESPASETELPSQRFRGVGPDLGISFQPVERDLPGMAGGIQGLFQGGPLGPGASEGAGSVSEWDGARERAFNQERPGGRQGQPLPGEEPGDPHVQPPHREGLAVEVAGLHEADPESGDLETAPGAGGEGEGRDGPIPQMGDSSFQYQPKIPPDLAEELETFSASYHILKKESGDRIRRRAEDLRQAKDHRALVDLICLLSEGGAGEGLDEEAVSLARDLTTPTEASILVARLGAAREEAERNRLARVISRTGREGAAALADALGESRDRSERRAFLDAMVTLGPLAFDMAKGMVDDPRWFVVRNGVAILGELGGEEAVAHLTETLAHEDRRVRKESVASLAKVGGKNAEALILGMLDDSAPDVRAAGCRGLGVLGSTRAVQPLMGRLKDRDRDVQIEALQALGRIGDPGPVRAIQKMALGGFFSRPPREVRLAAFRALAAIGTPGALRVLEEGVDDGDQAVRSLARSLVSRR